jgi:flagellar operon protein
LNQITNPALLQTGLTGPVSPAGTPQRPADAGKSAGQDGQSFAEVLQGAERGQDGAGQLQFSRHALARIQRRGIDVTPSTLSRLSEGVGRAAGKGSRDSLVLVDGTAFVVSVANRTVITAVGSEHMKDNVFTNIDSAVIA